MARCSASAVPASSSTLGFAAECFSVAPLVNGSLLHPLGWLCSRVLFFWNFPMNHFSSYTHRQFHRKIWGSVPSHGDFCWHLREQSLNKWCWHGTSQWMASEASPLGQLCGLKNCSTFCWVLNMLSLKRYRYQSQEKDLSQFVPQSISLSQNYYIGTVTTPYVFYSYILKVFFTSYWLFPFLQSPVIVNNYLQLNFYF